MGVGLWQIAVDIEADLFAVKRLKKSAHEKILGMIPKLHRDETDTQTALGVRWVGKRRRIRDDDRSLPRLIVATEGEQVYFRERMIAVGA